MRVMRRAKDILLIFFGVLWTLPVWVLLISSFRPLKEIRSGWWRFESFHFQFENYVQAWREGISSYYKNSFVLSLMATGFPPLIGALPSFAL